MDSKQKRDSELYSCGPDELQIPLWFLEHNVTLCAELEELEKEYDLTKSLSLKDSPLLKSDAYLQLRDLISAALSLNPKSDAGYRQENSIKLTATSPNIFEDMMTAVKFIARILQADLISVGIEDLDDLAVDFALQHRDESNKDLQLCDITGHWFANETTEDEEKDKDKDKDKGIDEKKDKGSQRSRNAVSSIVQAPKKRQKGNQTIRDDCKQDSPESTPILFHVRVAYDEEERSCGKRLLQTIEQRILEWQKSQRVALIVSFESDDLKKEQNHRYYDSWKGAFQVSIIKENCWFYPTSPPNPKELQASLNNTVNMRRLRRTLRWKSMGTDHSSQQILETYSQWKSNAHGMDVLVEASRWEANFLDSASAQIVGLARGKSQIEWFDILEVIARIQRTQQEERAREQEKKNSDSEGAHEIMTSAVKEACNKFERALLQNLVRPDDMRVTVEEVILDHNAKSMLQRLILIHKSRAHGKAEKLSKMVHINGVLMYGLPGTGKTHIARAIAKELGVNMLPVSAAACTSKWVGETDAYIKAAFTLGTKLSPCVLFFDEVDSLFYRRSSEDRQWRRSALNSFLHEMDGITSTDKSPFVLVATNRPADLDHAFFRRLPHKMNFSLPNSEQRLEILKVILKDESCRKSLNLRKVAKQTDSFSGSDLKSLCSQAALAATMELLEAVESDHYRQSSDAELLDQRHFEAALQRTNPSVTRKDIQDIMRFAAEYDRGAMGGDKPGARLIMAAEAREESGAGEKVGGVWTRVIKYRDAIRASMMNKVQKTI